MRFSLLHFGKAGTRTEKKGYETMDRGMKRGAAKKEREGMMSDRRYLISQLNRFKRYRSFTTFDDDGQRREYILNMPETATGLLRDVVATTTRLTAEQKREKKFALEAFAAYCMHILATKCAKMPLDDVMFQVYEEALKWLKKHFNDPNRVSFHAFLINRAKWRYRDILRKGRITITEIDEATGEKKKVKVSREVSLEIAGNDGEDSKTDAVPNPEVIDDILTTGADALVTETRIAAVNYAIELCRRKGELSQEDVDILCYKFGLGDGYEPLKQCEIAKKLGKSNAYITRSLDRTYDILASCIKEHKLL